MAKAQPQRPDTGKSRGTAHQARYQERYRVMKRALAVIRSRSNEPDIRAIADEALRGTQE